MTERPTAWRLRSRRTCSLMSGAHESSVCTTLLRCTTRSRLRPPRLANWPAGARSARADGLLTPPSHGSRRRSWFAGRHCYGPRMGHHDADDADEFDDIDEVSEDGEGGSEPEV